MEAAPRPTRSGTLAHLLRHLNDARGTCEQAGRGPCDPYRHASADPAELRTLEKITLDRARVQMRHRDSARRVAVPEADDDRDTNRRPRER
jgi:hypothetical protein